MRVLLVEDDEKVPSFVRRGLGFSVDLSRDGTDAFHQALHEPYDVMVLDIMIPFMDGLTSNMRSSLSITSSSASPMRRTTSDA